MSDTMTRHRLMSVTVLLVSVLVPAAASAQGSLDPVGRVSFPGTNRTPYDVQVVGSYAYTADMSGLTVYDVSDPSSPVGIGQLLLPTDGVHLCVDGDLAYVAAGRSGLHIIDVAEPTHPVLVGGYCAPEPLAHYDGPYHDRTTGLCLSGSTAHLLQRSHGLGFVDVSDPSDPTWLGTYQPSAKAYDVALTGATAYIATTEGLEVVDVGVPSHAELIGIAPATEDARAVALSGSTLSVFDRTHGLQVFDISDPASAILRGSLPTQFSGSSPATELAASGSRLFFTNMGIQVIDVSDPTDPREIDFYHILDHASFGVDAVRPFAYVAPGYHGFQVLDGGLMDSVDRLYVPAAAHVAGAAGTSRRTDLEVHNPRSTPASFDVQLLPWNRDSPVPLSQTVEIPGGTSVGIPDVLQGLFGLSGNGALRIIPDDARLLATSRTYNDAATGTYG